MASNPLNSQYELAKVETRPLIPHKFIRDQMSIDDIEGARSKKDQHNTAKTKEINKIDDIERTRARQRHSPRKNSTGCTSYDYTDVTRAHFMLKRSVNPLYPTHTVRDKDGKSI